MLSPKKLFCLLVLVWLDGIGAVRGQVPQVLSYQGRVTSGGVSFSGSGQFKFALVSTDGTMTYWSNDGTSSGGGQPGSAVALTVTNGLYSVLLGDMTLPNMTAIPASVFSNSVVMMRIWFDDGVHGSQQLAPDQRIGAVGYAVTAGGVTAGGVTSAMLAPGAVGQTQLAPRKIDLSTTSTTAALGEVAVVNLPSTTVSSTNWQNLGGTAVITSGGRPIRVSLQATPFAGANAAPSATSAIQGQRPGGLQPYQVGGYYRIVRTNVVTSAQTTVAEVALNVVFDNSTTGATLNNFALPPPGGLDDFAPAGQWSYEVSGAIPPALANNTDITFQLINIQLVVFEE